MLEVLTWGYHFQSVTSGATLSVQVLCAEEWPTFPARGFHALELKCECTPNSEIIPFAGIVDYITLE